MAYGGRGGIRTHGTLAGTPVFKTGALNHSATLPSFERSKLFSPFRRTKQNVANALQTSVLRALLYGGTEGAVNSRRTGPPAPGESIAAVSVAVVDASIAL